MYFSKPTIHRWGLICALALCAWFASCSPEHYKEKADEEVYKIIDEKWQEKFGTKANYVINDVEPSPNDIQITRPQEIAGTLSLSEAVSVATFQNREYQQQKEQLYLQALDLTLFRHQYTRRWFGTFDAGYARSGEDEQVSYDAGLGFNQLLADGASISTQIALDWSQFLTDDPDVSLRSILSASITQPLLRGAGRKIAQENLTQAERNVLYQIRSFNRFRQNFVISVISQYYRVLQTRDEVINAENNYQRRLESQDRLEWEARAGKRSPYEVDLAEQDVFRARDSVVRTRQRYKQALDEFKIRLALDTSAEIQLDPNELIILREAEITTPDFQLNEAVETAFLNRLDLANTMDRVDDAVRKVMVAADDLGTELNLVGSASADSTDRTQFERLEFHQGDYSVGIETDLPLDRKRERNAYRESLISLNQRQRQYDEDISQVELDVRQAYRELVEAAERYEIQKNSLELARKRVESVSLLLEAGRVTTRELLEAQDALVQAEDALTGAIVDHAIARLNFYRDIGILQVRPDGMWKNPEHHS